MSEQNKAVARRIFEEIESQGNLDILSEVFASDFVNEVPIGKMHGLEGARQFYTMLHTVFPDLHSTVEDQVAEGDKVATRFIASGTHRGEFMGVAPTGRRMKITGMVISRIANGKIVEQWGNPDIFGILTQIGAIPAPAQAG